MGEALIVDHPSAKFDLCPLCVVRDRTVYTRWNIPLPFYQRFGRDNIKYEANGNYNYEPKEILSSDSPNNAKNNNYNKITVQGYRSVSIMTEFLHLFLDACRKYDQSANQTREIEPWNDPRFKPIFDDWKQACQLPEPEVVHFTTEVEKWEAKPEEKATEDKPEPDDAVSEEKQLTPQEKMKRYQSKNPKFSKMWVDWKGNMMSSTKICYTGMVIRDVYVYYEKEQCFNPSTPSRKCREPTCPDCKGTSWKYSDTSPVGLSSEEHNTISRWTRKFTHHPGFQWKGNITTWAKPWLRWWKDWKREGSEEFDQAVKDLVLPE